MTGRVPTTVLFALALAGPVSGLLSEPERGIRKDEISKPLAELAAGKRDPRTLRIEVFWVEGGNSVSARLFGDGVGIWNERVQIRLSRPDVLSIASVLKKAHLGAMPSQVGEETDLLRLRGKMTVSIAGKTKGVVQLATGEQSEPLAELASKILNPSRERAKTSVTASSLADALAKLSTGALAPEALRLTAHRKPEQPDAAGRGGSFNWTGARLSRARSKGATGTEARSDSGCRTSIFDR